jgi:hypothetical protein
MTIRRSRTDTFEHTINGLLTKRGDFQRGRHDSQPAGVHPLGYGSAGPHAGDALGYDGPLDAAIPRAKRHVMFGRGELTDM